MNFWFRSEPAREDADDVILLTNGGNYAFSNGIYFKQRFGDEFVFGVTVDNKEWKITFRAFSGTWVHVHSVWDPGSGLFVTVDGTDTFNMTKPFSDRLYSKKDFDSFSDFVVGLTQDGDPIQNISLFQIQDISFVNEFQNGTEIGLYICNIKLTNQTLDFSG